VSSTEQLAGAGTIARASWVIWRRHTARALGATTRAVNAGLAVALLLCLTLAALVSAFVVSGLGLAGELPPGSDLAVFTRITAAGALIGGVLPQLLLAATRPRTSALGDLVAVLPVGATARALGERMPTVALGAAFSLVLSAPLGTFLVLLLRHEPGHAVGAVAAHVLLIVVAAMAAPAAFELLYALACRARVPHAYATGAATVLLVAVLAAVAWPALIPRPPSLGGLAVLSPLEATAQLAAARAPALVLASAAVLLGWAAGAATLAVVVARHPLRTPPAEYTRLLTGAPLPRGPRTAGVAVHGLALVRLPQYLLLGVAPVLLATALVTPVARAAGAFTEPLTGVPLVAPYAIAMFAFGLSHGTSWWVRGTGRAPRAIAVERVLAGAMVATPSVLVSATLLVATHTVALDTAVLRVAVGLVLCLAASLAGILTPWTQLSPLSTTITSAVTFLLFALAVVPLQLATETWMPEATAAAIAISGAVLLGAWAAVDLRQRDDDLAIA
jgi:hypothetical protein